MLKRLYEHPVKPESIHYTSLLPNTFSSTKYLTFPYCLFIYFHKINYAYLLSLYIYFQNLVTLPYCQYIFFHKTLHALKICKFTFISSIALPYYQYIYIYITSEYALYFVIANTFSFTKIIILPCNLIINLKRKQLHSLSTIRSFFRKLSYFHYIFPELLSVRHC